MNAREIAKFFSGVAANQVVTHGVLAVTGTQFTLFGITYSPGLNTVAVGVWSIVLVLLAYYSWIRR